MSGVRYEDMKVDRALMAKYCEEMKRVFNSIRGLSDIDVLLTEFERKFSSYIGRQRCVAVNSGTDALQMSLIASGIGPRDKVIVPAVTYPAVGYAVLYSGGEPIVVDVEPERFSLDVALVRQALEEFSNVKAVIGVHMFGFPCDVYGLLELKKEYGFTLIEDVCQAESCKLDGKMLGSFGDLACFSFSYYKPISSCGGGGGAICFDDSTYQRLYDMTEIWRDDDLLAKAGKRFAKMYLLDLVCVQVKFRYIDAIIKSRMLAKKWYEEGLNEIGVGYLRERDNEVVVMQNFPIVVDSAEDLLEYLEKRGVKVLRPYRPLSEMDVFRRYTPYPCPNAHAYAKKVIHLPLFSFIDQKDVEFVVSLVREFYGKS